MLEVPSSSMGPHVLPSDPRLIKGNVSLKVGLLHLKLRHCQSQAQSWPFSTRGRQPLVPLPSGLTFSVPHQSTSSRSMHMRPCSLVPHMPSPLPKIRYMHVSKKVLASSVADLQALLHAASRRGDPSGKFHTSAKSTPPCFVKPAASLQEPKWKSAQSAVASATPGSALESTEAVISRTVLLPPHSFSNFGSIQVPSLFPFEVKEPKRAGALAGGLVSLLFWWGASSPARACCRNQSQPTCPSIAGSPPKKTTRKPATRAAIHAEFIIALATRQDAAWKNILQ